MKTVFISGGSRSIGASIAREFNKAGYRVIIGYFSNKESAEKLAYELGAKCVRCNVKDVKEIKDAVKLILDEFGSIDVLINCAGIALKQQLTTDTTELELDDVIDVNLKGTYLLTREVLPNMISRKSGSIINLSSIWGIDGGSCETAYSATKGAIVAFTKALAKELGLSNIRVNAVAPGFIDTDMNKDVSKEDKESFCEGVALGRVGEPSEVAKAVLFLASDDASYITGQILRVDGGM